ncbi:hypothetical protein JKI95_00435 [Corynebacterium aquatimens]|uniref:hypothetical protein n=1 Tax=Corynebacterium aquatimens TaxID=1190508 RepID=UPI002541E61A|nr:hypothetical protein [Corynebacterium aquatimens]QYH19709.1 hypothetical protein JKI95_00435 [Corynebacterium aquatimens]
MDRGASISKLHLVRAVGTLGTAIVAFGGLGGARCRWCPARGPRCGAWSAAPR